MTNTMAVVMAVSRREGHVTFCISERTSPRNLNKLNFGICAFVLPRAKKPSQPHPRVRPASGPILGNLSPRKSEYGPLASGWFLLRAARSVKHEGVSDLRPSAGRAPAAQRQRRGRRRE